jgi:hypothetical protein
VYVFAAAAVAAEAHNYPVVVAVGLDISPACFFTSGFEID